ncbi:arabinofuranosidase catalytic domain-containing protein [Flavobacterium sp. 20NA77.7]|uniref:Arabinofuranosidase catalytic domain-containing protein n=1 Tax=Flavobacterium nakdongensis TaxID=3073563 RepID=A0ABY9RAG3_9FLAO|nr:arabinofuranosidase catalytic domain-containing protein [Flavobacterium sp. 20NA77.7]WMW77320.1 arabinofuranosidase catalytic domain-containing protein [Flavobacterium sp. 20NA77.7]
MKKTILVAILFSTLSSFAQVGVGTTSPNASSALDITSTTKGLLLPRLTDSQKMAISSPAAGLWIWCSDCGVRGQMQVYNGTAWTNMTGGVALSSLLLDRLASTPIAAYSLRLLRSGYIGNPAIRVRRSSDNTETNIGFTNSGDLDETALLAFTGSSDGFVTTWYDQSGNNNHAINTNTAAQPQLVFAGVVNKMNNKPAIKSTVARNTRLERTPASAITIRQFSVVGQGEVNGSNYVIFLQQAGPNAYFRYAPSGNIEAWFQGATAINSNISQFTSSLKIYSAQFTTGKLYSNGLEIGSSSVTSTTSSSSLYTLFNNPGNSSPLNGSMSEIILFPSAINRTILEADQGAYYSITVN